MRYRRVKFHFGRGPHEVRGAIRDPGGERDWSLDPLYPCFLRTRWPVGRYRKVTARRGNILKRGRWRARGRWSGVLTLGRLTIRGGYVHVRATKRRRAPSWL